MKKWIIPILSLLSVGFFFYAFVLRSDDQDDQLVDVGYKLPAEVKKEVATSGLLKFKKPNKGSIDDWQVRYDVPVDSAVGKWDRIGAWFKGADIQPSQKALDMFKGQITDYINSGNARSISLIEIGQYL